MEKMEMSELTIRLILLFLPGIISLLIIRRLVFYKDRKAFFFIIYALILGFISYAVYYVIVLLINKSFCVDDRINIYFVKSLTDLKSPIVFSEIIAVASLSIIIGFFTAFLINKKVLHHIAHNLHITKQFSEPDVWSFIFNSDEVSKNAWVMVRDPKNNIAYRGYVRAFSDTFKENELFLTTLMSLQTTPDKSYTKSLDYISQETPKS